MSAQWQYVVVAVRSWRWLISEAEAQLRRQITPEPRLLVHHLRPSSADQRSMVPPNTLRPLRPVLRILQQPCSRTHFVPHRRGFQVSRQCRSADEKQKPFKNQLYESTQQRLRRERAEQERYAQYQSQSQGGRYAGLMFGMSMPTFGGVSSLTFYASLGVFLVRCLLPGVFEAGKSPRDFDLQPV